MERDAMDVRSGDALAYNERGEGVLSRRAARNTGNSYNAKGRRVRKATQNATAKTMQMSYAQDIAC